MSDFQTEVNAVAADPIVWQPTDACIERSRLRRFYQAVGLSSADELQTWAIADVGRYWDAVVRELGFTFDPPYHTAVEMDRGLAWPEWFAGGGFNYVAQIFNSQLASDRGDHLAISWEGDDGQVRRLTYAEVHALTCQVANALQTLGIGKGDRVGIFLPMIPETAAAVLACGMVGAIYIPMFSGFGPDAVAARLNDCQATMLITSDGFPRRDSVIQMKQVADAALALSPGVQHCLVVSRAGIEAPMTAGRDHWWHDLVEGQPTTFDIAATAANDPYMIIYTSGTTGRPKGAVHVHAGFPVKAAHDLAFCFDLHDDDVLFWLTDLGWMMGPWAIAGGLLLGATVVMFEGTPDHPNPDRLWKVAERHRATVLGVAPTAIRALMSKGDEWTRTADLSSLRILGSTGETWNPDPWRWYFDQIGGGRLPIINYSGGTETGGGIVGCVTIEPIFECGFNGPVPGMDADVVDDAGQPVRGAVGELVVRQPWVGMTRGFWRDPDRYEETYWSRFPGIWVHGDWAEIDGSGSWFIRGRSDDTLKVAGKRVGPAEVESAAVAHAAVLEAAAIGIPHDIKGESVLVFAVLCPGWDGNRELADEVRRAVGRQLGGSMRPEQVMFVRELPKTRNAKIMRRVIRAAYLGLPTGDVTALENPDAVAEIAAMRS